MTINVRSSIKLSTLTPFNIVFGDNVVVIWNSINELVKSPTLYGSDNSIMCAGSEVSNTGSGLGKSVYDFFGFW